MKNQFNNLRARLWGGFLLIATIVLIFGSLSIKRISSAGANLDILGEGISASEKLALLKVEIASISQLQLASMLLVVVLSALVAFLLSRQIISPLRDTVRVLEKIGQGNTSERLPMGEPVNCSSIKKSD